MAHLGSPALPGLRRAPPDDCAAAVCAAPGALTRDPLSPVPRPARRVARRRSPRSPSPTGSLDALRGGAARLHGLAGARATAPGGRVLRLAAALVPGSHAAAVLERLADAWLPRGGQRLVLTVTLGLAVGAGATGPALAPTRRGPGPAGRARHRTHGSRGLAAPGPHDRWPAAAGRRPAPFPRTATAVVVRRGDSLWSIATDLLPATRTLGPHGRPRRWHRLHRANTARIGADPDLILPGTRLVVPGPSSPTDREERS